MKYDVFRADQLSYGKFRVEPNRNLSHSTAELDEQWPVGEDGRVISWFQTFHDMGLLFGVILPMWAGSPAFLMTPVAFIRRPLCWLVLRVLSNELQMGKIAICASGDPAGVPIVSGRVLKSRPEAGTLPVAGATSPGGQFSRHGVVM